MIINNYPTSDVDKDVEEDDEVIMTD